MNDLRLAVRALRAAPLVSAPAIVSLTLGVGANTAVFMTVLTSFRPCALLLAAVGMYGVMAYAVQQRTYEIGVRLALGAGLHQVRNMVLLDGVKLASCSIALGGVTAAALTGTLT